MNNFRYIHEELYERVDTFRSIHEEFYERVDNRKDELVELMLSAPNEKEVFSLVFNKNKNFNDFYKKITSLPKKEIIDLGFSLIKSNVANYFVDFKDRRQSYCADFLCFQFFDLYHVLNNIVNRYVYFEIYFDDNILAILMKKSSFNSPDRSFPAYDLDRREWSQAKLQMRMWHQFYKVEVEEIEEDDPKTQDLNNFLEFCSETKWLKNRKKKIYTDSLFAHDSIWIFIAYITMVQSLPLLSKNRQLSFTLNFFSKKELSDAFCNTLRSCLGVLRLSEKPLSQDQVLISNKYTHDNNIESKFERELSLIRYRTEKDFEYCSSALNKFVSEQRGNRKSEFPLQNVPILIGNIWGSNSAILNLSTNETDYINYLSQPKELQNLKDLLCDCFKSLFQDITQPWTPYRKHMIKCYEKSLNQWIKWRDAERLFLLSNEYLILAAWLGMLLKGGYDRADFEGPEDSNDIALLKAKLMKIEAHNQIEWKSFETFIKKMSSDLSNMSRKKPIDQEAFEALDAPILYTVAEDLIVYPTRLFEKLVQEWIPSVDPKQFIELSYQQNLLKTNATAGDKTYSIKFGKTCRTYSFIVSKLNSTSSI